MSVDSTDKGLLTPGNCVIAFIDHQSRMFSGLRSANRADVFDSLLVLAYAARIFSVPVVVSAVESREFSGEIAPELLAVLPNAVPIRRSSMNAWDSPDFVAAVKKADRKNLVIAALWSELCLVMPALQALTDGYGVYVVEDACMGASAVAHAAAIRRIEQAGGVSVTAMQVLLEFQRDWSRTDHYDEVLSVVKGRCSPLGQSADAGPFPSSAAADR